MSTNKTRYVILGLLNEEDLSGYEIKRIVDTRLSFFWNESFGQIYPELKALSMVGMIIVSDQSNKRATSSKKYAITDKGREELQQWLMLPVETEIIRYELLLKLYFSNSDSSETMLNHIKEFEINHKRQSKQFQEFKKQIKQDINVHSNHRQVQMVLSFGQKVWEAYADWCEETIKSLKGISVDMGHADDE